MKRLSLIVAATAFLLGACERHSWEDVDTNNDGKIDVNEEGTKRLYEKHGDDSGEAHAEEGGESGETPAKEH